mmetsp:Transcript_20942/g.36709  ORF Transcript_20942/g.36709 Transcript_20942/m.36709 type:complete len:202 (-) Transcript_20942:353-958(-)
MRYRVRQTMHSYRMYARQAETNTIPKARCHTAQSYALKRHAVAPECLASRSPSSVRMSTASERLAFAAASMEGMGRLADLGASASTLLPGTDGTERPLPNSKGLPCGLPASGGGSPGSFVPAVPAALSSLSAFFAGPGPGSALVGPGNGGNDVPARLPRTGAKAFRSEDLFLDSGTVEAVEAEVKDVLDVATGPQAALSTR